MYGGMYICRVYYIYRVCRVYICRVYYRSNQLIQLVFFTKFCRVGIEESYTKVCGYDDVKSANIHSCFIFVLVSDTRNELVYVLPTQVLLILLVIHKRLFYYLKLKGLFTSLNV